MKTLRTLLCVFTCLTLFGCSSTPDPDPGFPVPGPGTNDVGSTNWPSGSNGNNSDWLPGSDGTPIIQ